MRYKVMSLMDSTNDVEIYDPMSIDWTTFEWADGFFKHRLAKHEILKFYLVPYAYYGFVEYEDVILLLNKAENSWELIPETIIYVPKLPELQRYIRDNGKL